MGWHGLVPGAGHLEAVLSLLVHFYDKVVVLGNKLVHYLRTIEPKISDWVLLRCCAKYGIAPCWERAKTEASRATEFSRAARKSYSLRQAVSPCCEGYGWRRLWPTLAKIPLIYRQRYIQAEIELVFGQKGWDSPDYGFMESSSCQKSVQSLIKLLLCGDMLLIDFTIWDSVASSSTLIFGLSTSRVIVAILDHANARLRIRGWLCSFNIGWLLGLDCTFHAILLLS